VKILRIGTYPTKLKRGMGYHAYKISNHVGFKCLFIAPYYSDDILKSNSDHSIKLLRFLNTPRPRESSYIDKTFYLIKRMYFILEFSFCSIIYLIKYKPDIIHIHSPMHTLIALTGFLLGKKVYITFHGEDFYKIKNNSLYKILSFIYKDIFVLSPHMKSYLDTIHNPRNVHVVFNGVEKNIFYNKKLKRSKDFIAVGYLKEVKGFDYLIKAFKILCEKYNFDGNLKIAGSGNELDNLKDLSSSLGLVDRVIFLGELNTENVVNLYNQNEYFVLSSLSEGFPKVVLEAMACGNIIISTDVGSMHDILEDYPYICSPANEIDLSIKMNDCHLNNNEDLKVYLEKKVDDFSWESSANLYRKVYEKN